MKRLTTPRLPRRAQSGFIVGYLIASVVLMGLVVAAVAYTSRGSTASKVMEKDQDAAYAKYIIDAGALMAKAVFDYQQQYQSENGAAPDILSLTESTTFASGAVLDPAAGRAGVKVVPAGAMAAKVDDRFVIVGRGIRTTDTKGNGKPDDGAIVVRGITDGVCKQINRTLHGSASQNPLDAGRLEGCVAATVICNKPAVNAYYRIIDRRSVTGGNIIYGEHSEALCVAPAPPVSACPPKPSCAVSPK